MFQGKPLPHEVRANEEHDAELEEKYWKDHFGKNEKILLAALKRCVPWMGKLIADKGHENSVCPQDAVGALAQAEAAIAKIDN